MENTPNLDQFYLPGGQERTARNVPLAGFGHGLPISRLYARYFGGDMQLVSMNGLGTDAYLYLKRLGDFKEVLWYPYENPFYMKHPPSYKGSWFL